MRQRKNKHEDTMRATLNEDPSHHGKSLRYGYYLRGKLNGTHARIPECSIDALIPDPKHRPFATSGLRPK